MKLSHRQPEDFMQPEILADVMTATMPVGSGDLLGRRILEMLATGPKSCTEIGEELWSKRSCNRQSFARPAGKLLHRLKRLGLVEQCSVKIGNGIYKSMWRSRPNEKS
jgi:hypothetical protein